jgi:hypothetical protein
MAIRNPYQRKASAMGKYNQSLYDAMAEENIGNIKIKTINEQNERYSNLLDTAASYVSYREAKVARDETLENRKKGFEAMQISDKSGTYDYKKTTARDWLSGEAKIGDIGKESYTRDGKEIDTGTLDAFYAKTTEHEVADILGLDVGENSIEALRKDFDESKLVSTNISKDQYFGKKEGFDMGDIFGEESMFSIWKQKGFNFPRNPMRAQRRKRRAVMNYTDGTGIL